MGLSSFATASVFLALFLQVLPSCYGAVYKVGDSVGWTTIGNPDYNKWASSKTFHVGDIILFQYNAQYHNVMLVTRTDYKACNTSAPVEKNTSGNYSYTITTLGHHYFLCGVPGHCQSGQKVEINAVGSSSVAPASAPAPSPSGSSPSGVTPSPAAGGAPLNLMAGVSAKLWWALGIFAVLVSGFA
ncbi:Phytocyanin domain [Dillenia turbinata]|uniref:Phytocyanin domain n=1 Tax=Dillenia turbinata TaxID=194707 RepID=A0AAN8UH38_9MAGN